jgi:hypothetical protein
MDVLTEKKCFQLLANIVAAAFSAFRKCWHSVTSIDVLQERGIKTGCIRESDISC